MILFTISLILIFISSYLFASVLNHKSKLENKVGFISFLLIIFAQIILTFEVLSLFKGINQANFILSNLIFLAISCISFKRTKSTLYVPNIKDFCNEIIKGLKADKLLGALTVFWLFFLLISLFITIISPVILSDAMQYHLPRIIPWITNGSIVHYPYIDMRFITMPINAELVYAWILLFFKSDVCLGMLSFLGYINVIVVIYSFLKDLGYSIRKRIWTVLCFSSFVFVIIETSSIDTNLFTGSLLLTGIYLFYLYIKKKNDISMFLSALSFGISFGVKTTAIIVFPSVFFVLILISYLYNKKYFFKPLFKFCFCLALATFIFYAYNYILSYIYEGSFTSTPELFELHKFRGGIKGYFSNLLKYIFMLIDFSGITYMHIYSDFAYYLNEAFHALLGITTKTYASRWFAQGNALNTHIEETAAGIGILSLTTFIPAIFISFKRIFKYHSQKIIVALLGFAFVFNMILFPRIMVFAIYNIRYIRTFAVISAICCVYIYIKSNKNIYKWLLCFIISYYFISIPINIPYKNIGNQIKYLKQNNNIFQLRNAMRCSLTNVLDNSNNFCHLKQELEKNQNSKIAFFPNYSTNIFLLNILELKGYHIDYLFLEKFNDYNLSNYDIIVAHTIFQNSQYIFNMEENRKKYIFKGDKLLFDEDYNLKCYYLDYQLKYIDKNDIKQPIFSYCNLPFESILNSNFYIYNIFKYDYSNASNNNDLVIFKKIR